MSRGMRNLGNFVVPILLIISALIYYSQYYNSGFNYADEGYVALISQRVFEGEVPYKDISHPFGVLWYYSVAFLFWLFGVNFIVMKVYFFCLATVTALLGYATVTRLGSRKWLGFIAGLLLILLPGTIHKVFIPLAIVANMYFLSRIDLERKSLALSQMINATIVIAFTFLLRGDLGLCASAVFVGLVAYHTVSRPRPLREPLMANASVLGLAVGVFALVLIPFFILASLQGFLRRFTVHTFGKLMGLFEVLKISMFPPEGLHPSVVSNESGTLLEEAGTLLARMPIEAMLEAGPQQVWAILTYLPLLVFSIALLILLAAMIRRGLRGLPIFTNGDALLFVLFFLAIGAFPQYFFNRPDESHISQFMPGYTVFVFVLIDRCLPGQKSISVQEKKQVNNFILQWRWALGLFGAVVLLFNLSIYAWGGLRNQYTGSIAIKKRHTELFIAENGVRVYLTPPTHSGLTRVKELIETYTTPEDSVVCFPFSPGFNFMTNRRTLMRNSYVDDSWLKHYPGWQENIVKNMRIYKPAVVIIGNWAINGTEISRFPNWATKVCTYVFADYYPVDNVLNNTVYVRRDILKHKDMRLGSN